MATTSTGEAGGPTGIGAGGWWKAAKQTWTEAGEDHLGIVAAGIAFNAFLAVVPLLTATILTYGIVASPKQVAEHIATLSQTLPEQAASIIGDQLKSIVEGAGSTAGLGLLLAIGIAVFGAIRGASALIVGLNIADGVEESRSTLRQYGVALAITAGLVLMFILASVGISVVGMLEQLFPELGGVVHTVLKVGFWITAAAAVSVLIGLIYAYAPNREEPRWQWLTPGSIVATVVWILATLAFSFYVQNFGSYNATYGALGAVIVFLTWLYLSAYILLLGAELNQVLQRQAGKKKDGEGQDRKAPKG